MDIKETLHYHVCVSEYRSKIGSRGISVIRRAKMGSAYRQGKYNRPLREPRRAPLGTKIVSHMIMLTLPLSAVAHHGSPASHPRLTLAHLSSPLLTLAHPALPIKQPCSPFRTETDFVQVRIQVKQPAVVCFAFLFLGIFLCGIIVRKGGLID